MFKKLENLDEEYFYHYMSPETNTGHSYGQSKKLFWSLFYISFVLLFIALFMPTIVDFTPPYIYAITNASACLLSLYTLLLIITTPGKTLSKRYGLWLFVYFYGIIILQLTMWNGLLNIICLLNGGAIQYFILFLLALLCGIGFNFWVFRRGIDQIANGALKKGGDGFWGIRNKPSGKRISNLLTLAGPALTSFVVGFFILAYSLQRLSSFNDKLSGRPGTATPPFQLEFVWPAFFALLILFIFAACSAINYRSFIWLHLYRRFDWKLPMPEKSPKKTKGGGGNED